MRAINTRPGSQASQPQRRSERYFVSEFFGAVGRATVFQESAVVDDAVDDDSAHGVD